MLVPLLGLVVIGVMLTATCYGVCRILTEMEERTEDLEENDHDIKS